MANSTNKNFSGITLEVMDIYPVIRYSEIKYTERLSILKEEEKAFPDNAVQETLDTVANKDEKSTNDVNSKEVDRNTSNLNEKYKEIPAPSLPSKQLRQKASNVPENIDSDHGSNSCTTKQRRKSSVYETLDLASHISSRKSSMMLHLVESPTITALDLNTLPHFRPRSFITISLKPTKGTSLVKDAGISYQRSLQVADELTNSGGKVKSNILQLNAKRDSIGNVNLPRCHKPFISSLKARARSQLPSISQRNRYNSSLCMAILFHIFWTLCGRVKNNVHIFRRSTRRWNKPKPLKPIGISEVAHDRMRAGLVAKVMEHIDILVNEWFSGIKPELLIPCPYCMASKPPTTPHSPIHLHRAFSSNAVLNSLTNCVVKGGNGEDVGNAYVFSFDDCVWVSRNSSVIYCPAHGDIPLEFFVPDVVSG